MHEFTATVGQQGLLLICTDVECAEEVRYRVWKLRDIIELREPSPKVMKRTEGKNAVWWHAPESGFARTYLDKLPKKVYSGHAFAVPKLAR